jgi:hypothetical protein
MHPWQNSKTVNALTPQSVGTAGVTGTTIDLLGARWAQIDVHINSATAQPTVFKLTEGDTTTAVTDAIVAFTGGTATSTSVGFVIPTFDSACSARHERCSGNCDCPRGRRCREPVTGSRRPASVGGGAPAAAHAPFPSSRSTWS